MFCLPNRGKEPIFDPVTLLRPPKIDTTTSSPKLRLSLDRESLMTDADFEEIINKERSHSADQQDILLKKALIASPPPSSPLQTGFAADSQSVVRASSNITGQSTVPQQSQQSRSGIGHESNSANDPYRDVSRQPEAEDSLGVNLGNVPPLNFDPVPGRASPASQQSNARPFPRPSSIVPRVGTLTALPGSTMTGPDHEEVDAPTANVSNAMPPPPLPLSRPGSSRPSASHLRLQAARAARATATPTAGGVQTNENPSDAAEGPDSPTPRKRKVSVSSPFGSISLKRLLTPQKKLKSASDITHTTHEATAGNRGTFVSGTKPDNLRLIKPPAGTTSTAGMQPEPQPQSQQKHDNPDALLSTESVNVDDTMNMSDMARTLPSTPTPTPIRTPRPHLFSFTRARSRTANPNPTATAATATVTRTPTPIPVPATAGVPPSTSTPTNTNANTGISGGFLGTTKAALHRTIIQLRSQISDLTLKNGVLNEQIGYIRRDWHDTARELDLERMRRWEMEMELFRTKARLEEVVGENKRLKKGIVVTAA